MLTSEQCERVARTANFWDATVSLCPEGLRITMRHNGCGESKRLFNYSEIELMCFPEETLCDTIRNMATDKAPAPPPVVATPPAATLIVNGRRLAIGDHCAVQNDDGTSNRALILDIADHTIKVSLFNGGVVENVDFLRLRHLPGAT